MRYTKLCRFEILFSTIVIRRIVLIFDSEIAVRDIISTVPYKKLSFVDYRRPIDLFFHEELLLPKTKIASALHVHPSSIFLVTSQVLISTGNREVPACNIHWLYAFSSFTS